MNDVITALTISLVSFGTALIVLLYAWSIRKRTETHSIDRHKKNPIISPTSHNEWEAGGTFNPTAVKDTTGRVHLLYRAIGADGVSRIGYASSGDGINIDDHSPYPVFALKNPRQNIPDDCKHYSHVLYPSGGSWGGCEDPRAVQIGDKIYMTFNAFDGWDFIRIGVVSIKADDLFRKRWNWSNPFFISKKNKRHKNWSIFPEKINGKFAILHGIVPDIMVAYVDHLDSTTNELDSPRKQGVQEQPGREAYWDNMIRSAGPPPIKTEKGWLVLYHAMDRNDPSIGYKVGALLLDLNKPETIIARSPSPILVPKEWYENDWKAGVVYTGGTVIKNGLLYVYYGGGDKHICVAHTSLHDLLEWLLRFGKV